MFYIAVGLILLAWLITTIIINWLIDYIFDNWV